MLVKCKGCGEKIDRDIAYRVTMKGKNIYYCSKAEYDNIIKAREIKDNTYNLICQLFGYKITNTSLFKELNLISESHSYNIIFSYLQENYEYLLEVLSKNFNSEYAKIRYFSAILKNSLADFKTKEECIKKYDNSLQHNKFKRKSGRRSLIELEEEAGDVI